MNYITESLNRILCFTISFINFVQIIHGGLDTNHCTQMPCQNGGMCISYPGFYECFCSTDFKGPDCETAISEDTTLSEAVISDTITNANMDSESGTNSLSDGEIAGITVGCILFVIIILVIIICCCKKCCCKKGTACQAQ